MRDDFRERIHYANVALALTIPVALAGIVPVSRAGEGVQQAFGVFIFFLPFAIALGLERRGARRRERDQ